jgi:4-hydroxybenzoate-CoA ligase
LPDTVDYPVAFWGALRAGVIAIPLNTLLSPDLYAYIMADAGRPPWWRLRRSPNILPIRPRAAAAHHRAAGRAP